MIKKFIKIGLILLVLFCVAVFIHYFRYRYIPLVSVEERGDIVFKDIEGYTDQLSYKLNDTVFVSINARKRGKAFLKKLGANEVIIDSFSVDISNQVINDSVSEFGCNWNVTNSIVLDENYSPGYYTIEYKSDTDSSISNFIIENHSKSKIAVLAPISTWVAYNDWGGKSLYKNYIEPKTVYYVSTKRPFNNPIDKADSNIANFFITNYNAALIPDFYLETEVELLKKYDIIVLAYHCEYFSEKMYQYLSKLIKKENKSLISLGGNQVYWKTKWNDDYTVMECRKDLTSFDNSIFDYGGMWRHHFGRSEHKLLGVRFTEAGMDSYAPYKVLESNHWIFDGLNVKNGSVFGENGINNLPISGNETDKIKSSQSNMTLLAKGLNCDKDDTNSNSIENNCDENSGADFVIIENENNSILSTGSIESGGGLGIDSTFTGMIRNYISKTASY